MSRTVHRGIRQCPCQDCRESPKSATAEQHRTINRMVASFDEKGRRLFVAYLASQSGRGAIEHLAQITGMSPNTIRRGLADLKKPLEDSPYRVRQPGGGRKPVEKKRSGRHPGFGESVARCYGRGAVPRAGGEDKK